MSAGKPEQGIAGERHTTLVDRAASLQARLSNWLALALMLALGVGLLSWYYLKALGHGARAKSTMESSAHADSALPSLGRIDPPPPDLAANAAVPGPGPETIEHGASPITTLAEIPLTPSATAPTGQPQPPTPAELARQRQLAGAVFSTTPASLAGNGASSSVPSSGEIDALPGAVPPGATPGASPTGKELSKLLQPSTTLAASAGMLPAKRLLLPKGAFIDCTLETAIDSTLPGMTTCILATDTFGVDGKVVLLERGTKLIGETRGEVQQGQARIFVLWTEARTPMGVVVALASPGTDELGRSGLSGEVNRHFWQRFGAAILISVINGAAETAASRNGSGAVVIDPSASQGVTTEALKDTVNIPPTVLKHNGDRIQVLVARDLDFRSVYELRSVR